MSAHPDRAPTDAELLAAVAEGEPEAFGGLYDQHAPLLLVRLRQRTANQDLADQVAQETFLVVWRDAGRFRGRGEVGAWIWGIAIRRLLDVQRGVAAQGRLAGLLGRRRIPDAASAEEQALSTLEHRDVIRARERIAAGTCLSQVGAPRRDPGAEPARAGAAGGPAGDRAGRAQHPRGGRAARDPRGARPDTGGAGAGGVVR